MESSLRACPICQIQLPISEIERHADSHFDDDEEFENDHKISQELPSSSNAPSSKSMDCQSSQKVEEFFSSLDLPTKVFSDKNRSSPTSISDQVSVMCSCQLKSDFLKVDEGLMVLLQRCLLAENDFSCTLVCSNIDHFQSLGSEDLGWGCGWRNIQMLSSYLLSQNEHARKMLFGGSGFVPDIASLQRWLEIAWNRGFDSMGASELDFKVYGTKKWIGTTECAALFRSFGLPAHIVEFGSEVVRNRIRSFYAKKRTADGVSKSISHGVQVTGPLDYYRHFKIQCNDCKMQQDKGALFKSIKKRNFHICQNCFSCGNYVDSDYVKLDTTFEVAHGQQSNEKCSSISNSHQALVDWVWNYFSDSSDLESKTELKNLHKGVFISPKMPLYFQHDGHSRTVVGIQRRKKANNKPEEAFLLVLDPTHKTEELAKALRRKVGWQRMIKRGVHTLRKPEYQLCYVSPGLASAEELERLKIIDSKVYYY